MHPSERNVQERGMPTLDDRLMHADTWPDCKMNIVSLRNNPDWDAYQLITVLVPLAHAQRRDHQNTRSAGGHLFNVDGGLCAC